ncbi:MAG: glycoside hydrolase family 127 protein [Pirellulales bacterium]|nr:glycoside hydrolase family 127 protein [Pirellulales bacterium]
MSNSRKRIGIVGLVVVAVQSAMAAAKAPAGETLTPIGLREIKLAGEIGRRVDITIYQNLLALNTEKDFLDPFRQRNKVAGYIGLGKLIDATVRFAAYTNDEQVRALKNHLIAEAIKTQEPDGYIGILVPASRVWGVYDIHEMSYLVLGLTNDYKFFGEKASLEAARKLADFIITRWSAEPSRIPGPDGKRGSMYGVTTGLDGALLTLYEQTSDHRYLDFCTNFAQYQLPQWNVAIKLDGPRMDDERHSYIYMALCVAQMQLHGLQPDPRLLKQTQQAVDFLTRQDGLLITGSCSMSEGWHSNQTGSGPASESCATAYLTRMLDRLLRISGDAKYGDMMERIVFNALFAAQSPDGRRIRYFCPFEGQRAYFGDTYCCPNNFRRIIAELPAMVYYRSGDGLAVNLYTESTANVELPDALRLTLRQETGYPSSGTVRIHVDPSRTAEFPLGLRIPRWCTEPVKVAVNGQAVASATPRGSFLTIKRPWQAGDRIELEMSMPWRWIKGRQAQVGRFALMRGPLLFCLSPEVNRLPKELDLRKIVIDPSSVCAPSEDARVRPGGLACKVRAWSPGRATTQPSDLELLLTEFPDPSGTAAYYLLSDPSMSQDDELPVARQ